MWSAIFGGSREGKMDPELAAEFRAIHEKLDRLLRARVEPRDQTLLAALLPLIFEALGDKVFTVAELRALTVAHKFLPLAEALDAVGDPRAVGNLFDRGDGASINSFSVSRISAPGAKPVVWKIFRSL
ncbi:MAG TPA: hypothetical protein VF814_19765 [Casimicrobiaceae bacterium]